MSRGCGAHAYEVDLAFATTGATGQPYVGHMDRTLSSDPKAPHGPSRVASGRPWVGRSCAPSGDHDALNAGNQMAALAVMSVS